MNLKLIKNIKPLKRQPTILTVYRLSLLIYIFFKLFSFEPKYRVIFTIFLWDSGRFKK